MATWPLYDFTNVYNIDAMQMMAVKQNTGKRQNNMENGKILSKNDKIMWGNGRNGRIVIL